MIRLIQPLDSRSDFNRLTELLTECLEYDSFRFLSYSLIKYDKKTIETMTESHREREIDYLVYEADGLFSGVLAYRKNKFTGFELFLLAVVKTSQGKGIGQKLIDECIKIAVGENYKSVDSFVFADNSKMLRLLIKNDFRPVDMQFHARADGMDLVKLRKYLI